MQYKQLIFIGLNSSDVMKSVYWTKLEVMTVHDLKWRWLKLPIKVDQIDVNIFLDTRKLCGYNSHSMNKQIGMQAMNVNMDWHKLTRKTTKV